MTPRQTELIAKITTGPASRSSWLFNAIRQNRTLYERLISGQSRIEDMDAADDYRAYIELGRFRDPLVLDAYTNRPTEALAQFVQSYGLGYSKGSSIVPPTGR